METQNNSKPPVYLMLTKNDLLDNSMGDQITLKYLESQKHLYNCQAVFSSSRSDKKEIKKQLDKIVMETCEYKFNPDGSLPSPRPISLTTAETAE